jgi:hypothetical protein
MPYLGAILACQLISIAAPLCTFAHGFAGDRVLPATITPHEPFAGASELSLPIVAGILAFLASTVYSQRLFSSATSHHPRFGLSLRI